MNLERFSSDAKAFLEATDPALPYDADPLVMCEALYILTYEQDPRAMTVRSMIDDCSFNNQDYRPLAELVAFVARVPYWEVDRDYHAGRVTGCPMLAARLDLLCSRVLASVETLQPAELPILRAVISATDAEDEYGAVFGLVEDLIFHPNYP